MLNVYFPASMIAMLVVGCILLPVTAFWEVKFAKRPILARRFLANRTVTFVAWIGFFDFVGLLDIREALIYIDDHIISYSSPST